METKIEDDRRAASRLEATTSAIGKRVGLVSFVLPRVAAEYLLVAAAAQRTRVSCILRDEL